MQYFYRLVICKEQIEGTKANRSPQIQPESTLVLVDLAVIPKQCG